MAGVTNTGVVGFVSNPVAVFPKNSITVDIFGNTFYRSYDFGAGDDTGVYWNDAVKYTRLHMLFVAASMTRSLGGLFSYGKKLRSSKSTNIKISLPVTTNGEIDFDFMETFILELERERIHKLEAYLKTSGFSDYNLTEEEKESLKLFGSLPWREFRIGDLFEIKNTLSFNADRLTEGTEYDYITRTSFNQGILRSTGFVNHENVNNAGTWSLGLLQMDFFYRRKPWYAGQFVRKVVPKFEVNENVVPFFSTLLNRLKPVLLPVLVRNVDTTFLNTNILLPITANGKLDFDFMELFIRAVQKTAIKDVVLFTDEKIKATKRIANTLQPH